MTKAEFKERIKGLAFEVIKDRKKAEIAAVEYDELTKFPELKKAIRYRLGSTKTNHI